MHVALVCSDPRDCLRAQLAGRPARLADGVAGLLRASGHTATVVTLPSLFDTPELPAASTAVLADRLARTMSGRRAPDVVHALDVRSAAVGLMARSSTGIPVVMQAEPASAGTLSAPDRAVWQACLRGVDVVAVPGQDEARTARRLGVEPHRLRVVTLAAAGEIPARTALSVPSRERLVTVLSGAHAWGGTVDVVASLRGLPRVQLVVAGRCAVPDAVARLRRVAAGVGVSDRLTVVGWLSARATDKLVDRSAVVVSPRRTVTSGAGSLRAMGRGRPVVAYDGPAQREIVADGETGLLVRPGERRALAAAIAELVDDSFRLEAMGQAGQDRALVRFGPEPTLAATMDAYRAA